jgi:hypothetical protein
MYTATPDRDTGTIPQGKILMSKYSCFCRENHGAKEKSGLLSKNSPSAKRHIGVS